MFSRNLLSNMSAPMAFPSLSEIQNIFTNIKPNALLEKLNLPTETLASMPNSSKNEMLAKVLTSCVGLAVSFGITFVGVKWLVEAMDPTKREKKEAHLRAERMMKRIGVENIALTDYELCIASNLVDPLSMVVSWNDIGGLEHCIQEIQESVILPFRRQELFAKSNLLQPPKGVLLYGPPGCGKTMIAKATAKAAGARFINLQVSSLVDKWYGESQKRAEAVFSLALKLQPTIIFIDEIDSFLRSRTSTDHEATAMIKTQFMSFWDGLMTDANARVIIMGATNRPRDVDAAILRRMPSMFQIGLPKRDQRQSILELVLRNEDFAGDVNLCELAGKTEGFSGSDLKELCRNAAIYRVRDYLQAEREEEEEEEQADGTDNFTPASETLERPTYDLRPIQAADFSKALEKMKQNKAVSNFTMLDNLDCD